MKFALVSFHLPPSPSGQSMVLHRLLRDLDAVAYCLITSQNHDPAEEQENSPRELAGRLFSLPPEFQITRGYRYGLAKFREGINIPLAIILRAWQIAAVVRRENCRAIVACTGGHDLLDLPAAYLASRMVGVPFYPYYFDDYYYQWAAIAHWKALSGRRFARRLEAAIIRGAKRVIVPNEFMGSELRRRYGIETTLIHNPCDVPEDEGAVSGAPSPSGGEVRIVYTGAVYDAHYDAFLNLVEALKLLGRSDVKLHIYTAHSHSELAERGIRGPVVYHDHQSLS
ncbi:MAG: glycosyltransferase, partial [Acidobacteria bacterium]|nr:glycosyltransferase [Acidobacteriota bacterium]